LLYRFDTFPCCACGEDLRPPKRSLVIRCDCGAVYDLGWESMASSATRHQDRTEDYTLASVRRIRVQTVQGGPCPENFLPELKRLADSPAKGRVHFGSVIFDEERGEEV
jgi:hypothetical protein